MKHFTTRDLSDLRLGYSRVRAATALVRCANDRGGSEQLGAICDRLDAAAADLDAFQRNLRRNGTTQ